MAEDYNPTSGDVRPDLQSADDLRFLPLFADHLDSDPNNFAAKAIRAMMEEEEPRDRAEQLKESGNQAYKLGEKRWEDAVTYYSNALAAKSGDDALDATIYANRAQVQLKRGNFGRCLKDCEETIKRKPDFVKAYFRAATACGKLRKYEEGIKYSDSGLEKDPENVQLKKLRESILSRWNEVQKKDAKRIKKEEQEKREKEELDKVIMEDVKRRGLKLTWSDEDKYTTRAYDYKMKIWFDEDECVFPVMFIYPEFDQTDFIEAFNDSHRFFDHLKVMFQQPVPWDKAGAYKADLLDVYFLNKQEKLMKINAKRKLSSVVFREDYDIPQIPVFYILLRKSEFLKTFKSSFQVAG